MGEASSVKGFFVSKKPLISDREQERSKAISNARATYKMNEADFRVAYYGVESNNNSTREDVNSAFETYTQKRDDAKRVLEQSLSEIEIEYS